MFRVVVIMQSAKSQLDLLHIVKYSYTFKTSSYRVIVCDATGQNVTGQAQFLHSPFHYVKWGHSYVEKEKTNETFFKLYGIHLTT